MVINSKTIARICLVMLSLCAVQAHAALKAYVDRNPVAVDESLTLTVESDQAIDGSPDFNLLRDDFEVFSPSNSTSMQMINGSISRTLTWRISLIPKHAGIVKIPAFEVDGFSSDPILLNVQASNTPKSAQTGADLFMSVSVDAESAYVQQQIVMTVQFYRAVNIAGSQLSEPEISGVDAVVETLGDDREFQKTINGRLYAVFERRYVIFPQQSGTMEIAPMTFDVNVVQRGGNRRFDPFGMNTNTMRKRVRSEAITLDIKPIPAGMVGSWLPARALKLMEEWSSDEFVVGEPVTRTVAVLANGLTSAQLPEVNLGTPANVKVYPDQPVTEDKKDANGVVGIRQQKLAIIPMQPGKLSLPAVQLPWWNTEKQKLEVAQLPAKTVTVKAAAPQQQAATPAVVPQEPVASVGKVTESTDAIPAVGTVTTVVSPGWWPWVSLALGIAWFVTLIAWWRKGASTEAVPKTKVGVDLPAMRTSEKQLKSACQKSDAVAAKQALLAWAAQCWQGKAPASLTAMARLCEPQLAQQLGALDASLYSTSAGQWDGQALWAAFSQEKPKPQAQTSRNDDVLPALYPQ